MGRRKIEIEPLTDDRNRTVTFVKRKMGLFKKAHELAVLCQVDLAVVIIGNNNKVYEFSSVDMNELIGFYGSTIGSGKVRPQESKSPENYGNYRKKRRLTDQLVKHTSGGNVSNDSDSESDSDSPPRKRVKAEDFPTFNQPYKEVQDTTNHRPVLRVQIPGEVGAPRDSARTITAIESPRVSSESVASQPPIVTTQTNAPPRIPSINKPPNFMSFRDGSSMPDRKPTLPLPIQLKSQTSSPASATAPQLPQQQNNMFLMQSPPAAYPSGLLPTPVFNPYAGGEPKRPPLLSNIPYPGETPVLGLPSRYVNDMFPSPLTFYAPQDWNGQNQQPQPQNSGTGMTPIHGIPLYFMNMLPSGITPTTGAQMGMQGGKSLKELPSPLHFMSGGSFSGKK